MINFDYIYKYTFSFMPLVPSYIKNLKSYKPGKTIAEAKVNMAYDTLLNLHQMKIQLDHRL